MGQQQSNEKYNRRLSDSDGQYVYYSSSDRVDNVNDNVKGKGKNFNYLVPPKAKNNDKLLRINDLLYSSESKNNGKEQSTSKRNQLDFIDTSKTVDFDNFSDNILRNSLRNNINTPSRNVPIPRVHIRNENHHSSLVNSNPQLNDSNTEENNTYPNYSITVIHSSLPSSSSTNPYHLIENRNSQNDLHFERNTNNNNNNREEDDGNNHQSSTSINQNQNQNQNQNHESITHRWRSASEGNNNYHHRINNEMNDFPGPTNDRQDSRILIIQDTQTSDPNLSSNESGETNNNFVTVRTRNNNGERETAIIYQNNQPNTFSRNISSSQQLSSSSSSSSSSNINNHRRHNTTATSAPSTSENKKTKNTKISVKNKYKETTSVSLSYQNLSILPNYIFELKNLVYLDITHNSKYFI
ncbi:hypothetical protein PIROE2DRAFT_8254 [Piromyces sp. E2]|nr:hypothetical protein PIROE2DRAFT_8254 [Piromyces sp. E2]|eukprot:OUM64865.1 hypothetical protein PIROE2DRAFT_8254 [Piromyces sp. E2]